MDIFTVMTDLNIRRQSSATGCLVPADDRDVQSMSRMCEDLGIRLKSVL